MNSFLFLRRLPCSCVPSSFHVRNKRCFQAPILAAPGQLIFDHISKPLGGPSNGPHFLFDETNAGKKMVVPKPWCPTDRLGTTIFPAWQGILPLFFGKPFSGVAEGLAVVSFCWFKKLPLHRMEMRHLSPHNFGIQRMACKMKVPSVVRFSISARWNKTPPLTTQTKIFEKLLQNPKEHKNRPICPKTFLWFPPLFGGYLFPTHFRWGEILFQPCKVGPLRIINGWS